MVLLQGIIAIHSQLPGHISMLLTVRADAKDLPIGRVVFNAACLLPFEPKLSVVLQTFHDHSVSLHNFLGCISACFTFPWLPFSVNLTSDCYTIRRLILNFLVITLFCQEYQDQPPVTHGLEVVSVRDARWKKYASD